MSRNFQKLNNDKTKVLVVHPPGYDREHPKIEVDDIVLPISDYGKTLGVYFDAEMNLKKQVADICRRCYLHMRNITKIGSKLDHSRKVQLVTALILSRLDYCNSILYGCSSKDIAKLQKVQNNAVRFIFGLEYKEPTKNYLKELHFLPIKFRIQYKICLLCFKCLNHIAPQYLKNTLEIREGNRRYYMRLDDDFYLLKEPSPLNDYNFSKKSFSFSGPLLWNQLPYSIRCLSSLNDFKVSLKTYLFRLAFE